MRSREVHDYRSAAVYEVRIALADAGLPALAETRLDRGTGAHVAVTNLTDRGQILARSVVMVMESVPEIEVWHYTILPDHAHVIINYRRSTPEHLDDVVRRITDCAEMSIRREFPDENPADRKERIFASDYRDAVIPTVAALEGVRQYCAENPFRYCLKREYPHLFRRAVRLEVDGEMFTAYGNFLLLRHPRKLQVRVSRSFTADSLRRLRGKWLETARSGGVLVSPFISAAEKREMEDALRAGGRVVRVHPCSLTPVWQPDAGELELCRAGRLLIIAPASLPTNQPGLNREKCLMLNDIAKRLAAQIETAFVVGGLLSVEC